MTTLPSTPFELNRFWWKVEKTKTCWNWTGRTRAGSGQYWLHGRHWEAHRVSFELANGPIPDGLLIDHICFNRACVNPDHLRLATRKQNHEHLTGAQRNSTTGIRGVYRRRGRWFAKVGHNNKAYHLGYFDTAAEAEAAVLAKRLEFFTHNNVDKAEAERRRNVVHGMSGYRQGCRCDKCKEPNRLRMRAWREKHGLTGKGPKPWSHGTVVGYTKHKCRCGLCREAQRQSLAKWRAKQKATAVNNGQDNK